MPVFVDYTKSRTKRRLMKGACLNWIFVMDLIRMIGKSLVAAHDQGFTLFVII